MPDKKKYDRKQSLKLCVWCGCNKLHKTETKWDEFRYTLRVWPHLYKKTSTRWAHIILNCCFSSFSLTWLWSDANPEQMSHLVFRNSYANIGLMNPWVLGGFFVSVASHLQWACAAKEARRWDSPTAAQTPSVTLALRWGSRERRSPERKQRKEEQSRGETFAVCVRHLLVQLSIESHATTFSWSCHTNLFLLQWALTNAYGQ